MSVFRSADRENVCPALLLLLPAVVVL